MFVKYLLNFLVSIILLFFIIGLYQSIDYDPKYINRSSIQIDFNNIRTPFIKRVFLKSENLANKIFFEKIERENKIKKEKFPKYKYIYSDLNNIESKKEEDLYIEEWHRSNQSNFSQRFSELDFINSTNVENLEVAWIYNSGDGVGQIQSNPIVVNDKIITPTPGHNIVAIDSKSGEELWRFKTKSSFPAQRGLVYWKGNKTSAPGIFFSDKSGLYKLNIINGKLDHSFGDKGFIKTNLSKTAPLIIDDKLIISTFSPSIDIININSGKTLWKFFLKKKHRGFYVNSHKRLGGCNPWGGISADTNKKIVYITTGNAQPDYFGDNRTGSNKYCNSIIALDILNKKKLFDFQEISHDVWNRDMASPPILGTLKIKNKNIKIVIGLSKTGNIIVLERYTGSPIFDMRYRLGEDENDYGKYYLDLEKPEPLESFEFLISDLINFGKNYEIEAQKKLKEKTLDFTLNLMKNMIYLLGPVMVEFHGQGDRMMIKMIFYT